MPDIVICMLKSVCARPVLGAKIGWCDRCGKTIMISPSSRTLLAEPGTLAVCMECVMPEEWQKSVTVTAEQLKEVHDNLPPDGE